LGLVSELGVLTDYFVDAAKGSFKAMKLAINAATNGAGFTAAALAVTPILQKAVDLLYDWSITQLGSGGWLGDSIIGGGSAPNFGGGLGGGEGESAINFISRLAAKLATEIGLPKELREALESAISMMKLMENGNAAVYEWLGAIRTKLGAQYADQLTTLLRVIDGDKLADVGKRLGVLAGSDALKKEYAELGSSALLAGIARSAKIGNKDLSNVLDQFSTVELADLLMTLGKTTKEYFADSILIGDLFQFVMTSRLIAKSDLNHYFDDLAEIHVLFQSKKLNTEAAWVRRLFGSAIELPVGTIGLGKNSSLNQLGNVSIAKGDGWNSAGLTGWRPDTLSEFQKAFEEATKNATQIRFNLPNVKIERATKSFDGMTMQQIKDQGLITEWELHQLLNAPKELGLLSKTIFFHDGPPIIAKNCKDVFDLLKLLAKAKQ
jgi:hypothetical protein